MESLPYPKEGIGGKMNKAMLNTVTDELVGKEWGVCWNEKTGDAEIIVNKGTDKERIVWWTRGVKSLEDAIVIFKGFSEVVVVKTKLKALQQEKDQLLEDPE